MAKQEPRRPKRSRIEKSNTIPSRLTQTQTRSKSQTHNREPIEIVEIDDESSDNDKEIHFPNSEKTAIGKESESGELNAHHLALLMSMGFKGEDVICELRKTHNFDEALSHLLEISEMENDV
jgi:hypothetical protein